MFQKLLETVRELTGAQGFEAYLRNVQKNRTQGAPTREEALKDFQAMNRRPL